MTFLRRSGEKHEGSLTRFDAKWVTECLGANGQNLTFIIQHKTTQNVAKGYTHTFHELGLFHYYESRLIIIYDAKSFKETYAFADVGCMSHLLQISTYFTVLKFWPLYFLILPNNQSFITILNVSVWNCSALKLLLQLVNLGLFHLFIKIIIKI